MALYDNKFWLLSHIRNSFISTDDTGMSEMVMTSEDIPKHLADKLDIYRDPEDSDEEEDDMTREPYDFQSDLDFELRLRSNTTVRKEKDQRCRAPKINIKWELSSSPLSAEDADTIFARKNLQETNQDGALKKSLLSERLKKCADVPQNPYVEYARFDGSNLSGIAIRRYKIFLTMLPGNLKNFPLPVICLASATVEQLTGFILCKCSAVHGNYPWKAVPYYGLYITEEDGEVDYDFPAIDTNECIAKFGFTCFGLVEYKDPPQKNVGFEASQVFIRNESIEDGTNISSGANEAKQITANTQLMEVHMTAMEAPLYQSYRIFLVNKVKAKAEIHLGISGEKIEIDPLPSKNSKIALVRQKPVTHHIDSIAWCEITDNKSNYTAFKVVYSPTLDNISSGLNLPGLSQSPPALQASINFKHYDFEADHTTAEEIVQKINLILELRSSASRKEYLATRERKLYRKKTMSTHK